MHSVSSYGIYAIIYLYRTSLKCYNQREIIFCEIVERSCNLERKLIQSSLIIFVITRLIYKRPPACCVQTLSPLSAKRIFVEGRENSSKWKEQERSKRLNFLVQRLDHCSQSFTYSYMRCFDILEIADICMQDRMTFQSIRNFFFFVCK